MSPSNPPSIETTGPAKASSDHTGAVYGPDRNGLIWGYFFSPDQAARAIAAEALPDSLARATEAGTGSFLWLHFATGAASERWMRGNLDLPGSFHESLHEEAGSTRLEQEGRSLAERVKLLQEEMAAILNEQTGRTLFLLTIVTVLALPINLIAGLFGMNVGGIPLADYPHGFSVVVGTVIAMTSGVAWLVWIRRR